jgi:hypothetical protein
MQLSHSAIEIEHRFTLLEVSNKSIAKTQAQHSKRIESLEARVPKMEPRDWLMALAGAATILAALAGRIPWDQAFELLAKH